MHEQENIEEIVIQAQHDEEVAFEALMEKYGRLVYYIAIQKMGNAADAMDVVQETFIEVRKSIKNLKEPRYFKSWLNRIVYSKVARFYEKRRDRVMDENELRTVHKLQEQRVYMNPEKHVHFQTDRDILHHCIHKLKPIYQDVLILQYFEECTMVEIAEILGIPQGTVKSRISSAKKELKVLLEEYEEEEGMKLNFHNVGLEAFLLGAFSLENPQALSIRKFGSIKGKNLLTKIQAHPFLISIASTSVIAGSAVGVYGAYTLYQNMQEASPLREHVGNQDLESKQEVFPVITYQGEVVSSARKAYEILYNAAFYNVNQSKEDLRQVYDTLENYGGSYASMADHIKEFITF